MPLLFAHQLEGARALAKHSRYILGDEVGTGKTRTTIAALALRGTKRPLVICPASARGVWAGEFNALVSITNGMRPHICSFDEIVRGGTDLMVAKIAQGVDALVIDESHYLKNADAKRTRTILGRDGYARRLPTVYALSGTPMHRNPLDLWPLFASLFPEQMSWLGIHSRAAFVDRFCVMSSFMVRNNRVEKCVGVRNPETLNRLLNGVMLRRTVAGLGLDVPKVWWQTLRLDTTDRRSVDALLEGAWMDLFVGGSLEELIKSPHMATTRRKIGELKAPEVARSVGDELDADPTMKVVILAQHHSVLDYLEGFLSSRGLVRIDGSTAPLARTVKIQLFQTDPDTRVFLGQQTACKEAITLTAANRVILVEPSWVAVDNVQAAARVARIGQVSDRCICQIVTLAGTLDEAIVAQHHKEIAAVNAALAPISSTSEGQ